MEEFLFAAFARRAAGPPPVMRCRLEGRHGREAQETYYRHDLAEYERSLAARAAPAPQSQLTQTMAAPLTHGVAPALERCAAITLAEAATAVNCIWTRRVLFVRTTAPCLRVVATSLLVEDEAGDVLGAHLYNCVARDEDPRGRFPPGMRLALLEPYLRHAKDDARSGVLMLRCDNPQAVVVFETEAEWRAARERARLRQQGVAVAPEPPAAAATLDAGRADELCAAGNAAFKSKAYDAALRCYSAALEHAPGHALRALANRCAVHLRCERWRAALADAEAVLRVEPRHAKSRARAAACLLSLRRVAEARAAATQLVDDLAAAASAAEEDAALRREAGELVADAARAAAEQRGEYDLKALQREAAAAPDGRLSWRHAEFESAALRVDETATKGRRVVATEPLAAGTLLMAAKALAFVLCSGADTAAIAVSANSTNVDFGSQSFMLPSLVHTLFTRPEIGEALYSLSGGAAYPPMPASGGDATRVDVKRLEAILCNNWFQAGGNEMKLRLAMRAWAERLGRSPTAAEQQQFGDAHRPTGSGLWVRPSLLNHSCAPNCLVHQEGDFMFVFAARDVEAGEELCIGYCDVAAPFAERTRKLAAWNRGEGFRCDCVRCDTCRRHPEVAQLEADINAAYRDACCRHVAGTPGPALVAAVEAAMPRAARRAARARFDALPLACQLPLCPLLELEAGVLMAERQTAAALAAYVCIEAIRAATHGGDSCGISYTRLREKLRVVGAALTAGRDDLATAELRRVVAEACVGPRATLTAGNVAQFALDFAASVQAPPAVLAALPTRVAAVLRELLPQADKTKGAAAKKQQQQQRKK